MPASIAVIGLGVIGLEIGQSLARLGVEVTGFDMLGTIGGLEDPDVAKVAVEAISKDFRCIWEPLRRSAGERQTAGFRWRAIGVGRQGARQSRAHTESGQHGDRKRRELNWQQRHTCLQPQHHAGWG